MELHGFWRLEEFCGSKINNNFCMYAKSQHTRVFPDFMFFQTLFMFSRSNIMNTTFIFILTVSVWEYGNNNTRQKNWKCLSFCEQNITSETLKLCRVLQRFPTVLWFSRGALRANNSICLSLLYHRWGAGSRHVGIPVLSLWCKMTT